MRIFTNALGLESVAMLELMKPAEVKIAAVGM